MQLTRPCDSAEISKASLVITLTGPRDSAEISDASLVITRRREMKATREPEFGHPMNQATVLALGRSMSSLLSALGVEVLRELKWFRKPRDQDP
jgi:hypothetical protein